MKYLKKFATEADVDMLVTPNVVLIEDSKKVLYNALKEGVFIQHVDGTIYAPAEWTAGGFSNSQANGVAVVDKRASFIISKTVASVAKKWSSDTSNLIDGVFTSEDEETAKADYAGAKNTALIAATDTSDTAYACANYVFPNGRAGYLPALGEWDVVYSRKSAIDSAMSLIGGTALGTSYVWTSTQGSATRAWWFYLKNGTMANSSKTTTNGGRAFTTL